MLKVHDLTAHNSKTRKRKLQKKAKPFLKRNVSTLQSNFQMSPDNIHYTYDEVWIICKEKVSLQMFCSCQQFKRWKHFAHIRATRAGCSCRCELRCGPTLSSLFPCSIAHTPKNTICQVPTNTLGLGKPRYSFSTTFHKVYWKPTILICLVSWRISGD